MADDLVRARYPTVPLGRGHYESYYLTAHHPSEPRAIWLRYTILKRPGQPPTGATWVTLFEPHGVRALRAAGQPTNEGWLRIGDNTVDAGRAAGAVEGATWELCYGSDALANAHLPAGWMYRAPVPRTKPVSLHPITPFEGRFSLDGTTIDVGGWRGMVGHNWGAEHAERWIWLHGLFGDDWIDVVLGRIKLGPVTTPWVANGVLSLDGVRHRLGGLGKRAEVSEEPLGCELVLPGKGLSARVAVSSPAERVVGWRYADPAGHEHHVFNGSTADMSVVVGDRTLTVSGAAAYELGTRDTAHGLTLQPYPADA